MMSSKKKLGELIYTLEDHIYDEASDAFEKLYDETDPGKMVKICGNVHSLFNI